MGAQFEFQQDPSGVATLRVAGDWSLDTALPAAPDLGGRLDGVSRVRVDATDLGTWDTSLLAALAKLEKACTAQGIAFDRGDLPEGARRLLALAAAVPEKDTGGLGERPSFLERVGLNTVKVYRDGMAIVTFLGESILVFGRFLARRARYRRSDLATITQQSGAEALAIVSVITFLIGLILAFVGALQLQKFGASIYVADLVGVGMTREMAPLMTAIIMAGRTGAAFAAQLGTMTVNEEIDALRTFGIPPMDFLVLPRMLALMLMMPLLSLYGMAMGMFAGGLSAWAVMDISPTVYVNQIESAVDLTSIGVGLFKAAVFGVLVAVAGCLRGMQCGRNAAAVGVAATSAVVTSIVLVITVDAIFNIVTQVLGI